MSWFRSKAQVKAPDMANEKVCIHSFVHWLPFRTCTFTNAKCKLTQQCISTKNNSLQFLVIVIHSSILQSHSRWKYVLLNSITIKIWLRILIIPHGSTIRGTKHLMFSWLCNQLLTGRSLCSDVLDVWKIQVWCAETKIRIPDTREGTKNWKSPVRGLDASSMTGTGSRRTQWGSGAQCSTQYAALLQSESNCIQHV